VRALPNDAIVSDGGLNYIFVLKPSSTDDHEDEYVFRKIEVNTGATDIGFTEVVPVYNLPEHVQMVTSGAFYLLAEMKKGEGGHGHHH
jgi:membrane fusion protein, heavy metal efflux system